MKYTCNIAEGKSCTFLHDGVAENVHKVDGVEKESDYDKGSL